jgi:hypothetical protein
MPKPPRITVFPPAKKPVPEGFGDHVNDHTRTKIGLRCIGRAFVRGSSKHRVDIKKIDDRPFRSVASSTHSANHKFKVKLGLIFHSS